MAQTTPKVSDTLKINVRHGDNGEIITTETTVSTPNTGVGYIASELGATGCSAIGIAFIAIILFCLRGKIFKKTKFKAIPSLALLLFSGALAVAGTINGVNAVKPATEINITTNPKTPVIGSNSLNIELNENYEHGYTIYAYLNNVDENNIYNADLSAKITGTEPTDSLENLSLNSYGIKNQIKNGYYALPIGENNAMPIYTTGSSAEKGDIFTSDYVAKLDSTISEGVYSSDSKGGEIVYEIKPGQLINVFDPDLNKVIQVLAICNKTEKTCEDESSQKYIDWDNDNIYNYATDFEAESSDESIGTVEQFYHVIPSDIDPTEDGINLKINGTVIATAAPNPSCQTGYTCKFINWGLRGYSSPAKIIAEAIFEKEANTYEIALNSGEGTTSAGTGKIYETYGEKFALISGGEAMSTTENPITIPEKTDFEFGGYYTEENGAGTQYIDKNGYLTTDADSTHFENSEGKLYAKWSEVSKDFFSITTMQEMTPEICATATKPAPEANNKDTDGTYKGNTSYIPTTTLKDSRDNKEYTVERLADGKCWMVNQDLDLELDKTKPLTAEDTDLQTITSWTPSVSTSDAWITGSTTPNSRKTSASTMGIHYTLLAATATDDNEKVFNASGKMNNTICPKGWTIPESYAGFLNTYNIKTNTQLTTTEYERLVTPSTPWYFQELSFVGESGAHYISDATQNWSHTGWYWTSTKDARDSNNKAAFGLIFGGNNPMLNRKVFSESLSNDPGHAYTIRCVAR